MIANNKRTTKAVIVQLALLVTLVVATPATRSTAAEPADSEEINWQVISSGGTSAASTNFSLMGTVAQNAVGSGSSINYGLHHGFWQQFGPAGCCLGIRGNVDGDPGDQINVADLTFLVDFLFRGGPAPPCPEEGDVNGAGGINVADLTYLVDFLFRGGATPAACP